MSHFFITALSEDISNAQCNNGITESLQKLITDIQIISNVVMLESKNLNQCRFRIQSPSNFVTIHLALQSLARLLSIDIILNLPSDENIVPRLLIMDMDSTLVQAETIDEIARVAGVGEKVAEITESAMRGELDFTESLHARVSMLKGVAVESIEEVHGCLPLTDGARELLLKAKAHGCHTALVSGGFTLFARPIAEDLGFDTLSANVFDIVDGKLTGKVTGDIVDGNAKLRMLTRLKNELNITTPEIVAIGDGANDLPMLTAAGTGIAFHAKPKVQQQATSLLNHNNLDAVCWFLNW